MIRYCTNTMQTQTMMEFFRYCRTLMVLKTSVKLSKLNCPGIRVGGTVIVSCTVWKEALIIQRNGKAMTMIRTIFPTRSRPLNSQCSRFISLLLLPYW